MISGDSRPDSQDNEICDLPADGSGEPSPGGEDTPALLRRELAPELEVSRRIGRGRMAEMYLAREPALMRLVAVKVLSAELSRDASAIRRFEREARSAAAISHPNVVQVHRVGRLGEGRPYIVMQHVKGRTLEDRIQAEGPLRPQEACRILADLASALQAAHALGIVHREVKPANVLQEDGTGRVLLADFGIAALLTTGDRGAMTRLTRTGELLGEVRYASPEQLRGEEVTEQTDVYGLGLLAYELLTGAEPFETESAAELTRAHLAGEPVPIRRRRPEVPPGLERLVLRCLSKNPRHRPTAADVERSLEDLSDLGPAAPSGEEAASDAREETAESASPAVPVEPVEGTWFQRLHDRRVPHIVGSFAAIGWIVLQGVDQLVANEILPPDAYDLCFAFFAAGLPASFLLAWFHGKPGAQRVRPIEMWLFGTLAFGWLIASAVILAR